MNDDRTPDVEQTQTPEDERFEAPAIVAIGRLDQVTFGAPGEPFEGETSYL